MSTSRKILSGVIWSIIMNIFNALYGFIMIPLLISYFGKTEYALIGLAQSINAYMQLMDMGLTSTNVRFFSNWLAKGDSECVRKLFSTSTTFYGIIGFINVVVLLVVYLVSDKLFNVTSEQNIILQKLILILAASAFVNWFTSCYNQIIQATENVAWIQKRLLFTKVLMVFVLIITIYCKLNIIEYFALTVLSNWIILPTVIIKIKKVAPMVSFKLDFDKAVFKEIFPYTFHIFSFTFFSFSYQNLKPVFLGMQGNIESVTDYRVIMGIVGICSAVSGVFMSALLPSSSKIQANKDIIAYNRVAYQGTKFIMIFMGFCVFGIMSIVQNLVLLYVGPDYLYLIPSLNIFLLILLSNHILGISSLILGGSNIRPLSMMTAFSTVLALIVCWLLIPKYQVMGVAIASVIYTTAQMLFYYLYFWPQKMNINSSKIFKTIFIPITIFGAVSMFVVSYIPSINSEWLDMLIKGFSFCLIYVVGVFIYLDESDKEFLCKLFNKGK